MPSLSNYNRLSSMMVIIRKEMQRILQSKVRMMMVVVIVQVMIVDLIKVRLIGQEGKSRMNSGCCCC